MYLNDFTFRGYSSKHFRFLVFFFSFVSTGDRVAIEPHGICRTCDFCKEGRYNLCENVFFLAAPPDDGALARYHVHGADFLFK